MKLDDSVYGSHDVENQVIRQLIESEPVQRLKNISQSGPSPFFMEEKPKVTRYDHSIGVMMLLRRHGASLEEQIAGLLHDIPHTAFSHVADFVFENKDHEYHEQFMDEIVYSSGIPDVIEKHGYETERILDEDKFSLLERELPRLCADRLDYSIRDLKMHEMADIRPFLEKLTTHGGEFVFEDFETAEKFGLRYIELDEEVYASPREVAIHHLFAQVLKEMLDEGELTEEELFRTDSYVLEEVRRSGNKKVRELMDLLDSGIKIETGVDNYDFMGETKARAVDPPFMENGKKIPASERSERLEGEIERHLEKINSGLKIKVEGLDETII